MLLKKNLLAENNYLCVWGNFSRFAIMKQEAVGTITKSGGFSRVVREVHDTGEPLQIIRHNEIVAMIIPANADMVKIFELSMNFGKTVKQFVREGLDYHLELHLLSQIITGLQAKALLVASTQFSDEQLALLEKELLSSVREALKRALDLNSNNTKE